MQKIFITLMFCLVFGVVTASAQKDYCFENDGLKMKQTVRIIVIDNKKIEGVFESSGYDDGTPAKSVNFNGTKTGNLLAIIFDGGKPPYEVARGTRKIVWSFSTNALKIPIYGKNYDTNRYSTYTARFDKCQE